MGRPLPSMGSKLSQWTVGWMFQVDVYLGVRWFLGAGGGEVGRNAPPAGARVGVVRLVTPGPQVGPRE